MKDLFEAIKKILEEPDTEREYKEWKEKHGAAETDDRARGSGPAA